MFRIYLILTGLLVFSANTCEHQNQEKNSLNMREKEKKGEELSSVQPLPEAKYDPNEVFDGQKIKKSDLQWKESLLPEQYRILRQKGTECSFTGNYLDTKKKGTFYCSGCALPLFKSDDKFNSGTGWPSFFQPVNEKNVGELPDNSHGMRRVEVVCNRCDGHLGHVFEDGPRPTGLRYCINSEALYFVEEK